MLLKADFRIFYFELKTLLNKLVKLCGYFFPKNNFEQKWRVLISSKRSTYFLTGSRLRVFELKREKKLEGYINFQGTEVSVRDREILEIEGSRDRENPL